MRPWGSPLLRAGILSGDEPGRITNRVRASYVRAAILATPDWVNRALLLWAYRRARELTNRTGERYVVDHIVPLVHPYVCGLNVPYNIRVIPERVNQRKSNSFNPDQVEIPLKPPKPLQIRMAL